MRRITVVGMIILSLVAVPLVVSAKPAPEKKIEICHETGDGAAFTIEVGAKAAAAHEAHGDEPGACVAASSSTPLVADFTVGDITCEQPSLLVYCDVPLDAIASQGEGLTYAWMYSNGGAPRYADGMTPTLTYVLPGTYLVTLTIDTAGHDPVSITKSVDVFPQSYPTHLTGEEAAHRAASSRLDTIAQTSKESEWSKSVEVSCSSEELSIPRLVNATMAVSSMRHTT